MSVKNRSLSVIAATIMLVGCAFAATNGSGTVVKQLRGSSDILAVGDNVSLTEPTKGDAIAAGQTVSTSGGIANSLMAAGRDVILTGNVGNDVFLAGSDVSVSGTVADNAYLAGNRVIFDTQASSANLFIAGSEVSVLGKVAGDLNAASNSLYINSVVGGDAEVSGQKIVIGPQGVIKGNLRYEGRKAPVVQPGGKVMGTTSQVTKPGAQGKPFGSAGFVVLMALAYLVFGLLMVWAIPARARSAAEAVAARPGASIGIGAIVSALAPIAIIIALVTLIGIPAALMFLLLYAVLLYAAWGFAAMAVGKFLLEKIKPGSSRPAWSLIVGVGVLAVIALIPVLGFLANLVALTMGLGAYLVSWWTERKQQAPPLAAPLQPAVEAV